MGTMIAEMNDKEIEAVALITFRAVWARRLEPDELFEIAWKGIREEEIFRVKLTIMAARAVARDGLEAR